MEISENLKLTLDISVQLISVPLTLAGLAGEVYEYNHEFHLGSHAPAITAGISALGIYYEFLRRKFLRKDIPDPIEY